MRIAVDTSNVERSAGGDVWGMIILLSSEHFLIVTVASGIPEDPSNVIVIYVIGRVL